MVTLTPRYIVQQPPATEGTPAETNLQIIEDVVTSGNLPTDAATYPM